MQKVNGFRRHAPVGIARFIAAGGVFLLFLLLIRLPVSAEEDRSRSGATLFSDSRAVQEMPAGWEKRPVYYSPETGKADLAIILNQHFTGVLEPLIRQFAVEQELVLHLRTGTCGVSAMNLSRKAVDIGTYCCPPAATDRLPGLDFHTLGIHPIAIITHRDNPVADVSLEQLRRIFAGDIRRWSELGWRDIPIQVIGRLHCKKRPGHWRKLLDNEDLFSPSMKTVGATDDMFRLVSEIPGAIGWEVLWQSARLGEKLHMVKVDGYDPKDFHSVLSGGYPLYRVISLTTWASGEARNPRARELVEFLHRALVEQGEDSMLIQRSRLVEAGWKFDADELVGEPDR